MLNDLASVNHMYHFSLDAYNQLFEQSLADITDKRRSGLEACGAGRVGES